MGSLLIAASILCLCVIIYKAVDTILPLIVKHNEHMSYIRYSLDKQATEIRDLSNFYRRWKEERE